MTVSADTPELAATRVLQELRDKKLIELVSSDSIASICGPLASFLAEASANRAAVVSDFLCAHREVEELFASDELVEQILQSVWDESPAVKGGNKDVVFGARNEALEKRLSLDPEHAELLLVYGDWLQERGDPLGELIAHQSAAASSASASLHPKAAAFLERHQSYFLGLVADYQHVVKLDWQQGFIRAAAIGTERREEVQGAILLRSLLELPTARLLQDLRLGPLDHTGEDQYSKMVAVLLQQPHPTLKTLVCGLKSPSRTRRIVLADGGDLRQVTTALPQLRTLELRVAKLQLGPLESTSLRELTIDMSIAATQTLLALANSSLPALERLELSIRSTALLPHDHNHYRALLESKGLPGLRELTLPLLGSAGPGFSNHATIVVLAESPLLRQLERLDLSNGHLTDFDTEPLVDHHEAFAHLEKLDLRNNELTDSAIARLRSLGPMVLL